jgi:RNA polymerase sigma-70 factor (ECF subfamily)
MTLESFYTEYYSRIHRYLLSMVRDGSEAEDLVQETFLRACQHQENLRDQRVLLPWLYRIATHVALDRLRQRSRRAPYESETDPEEADVADGQSLAQLVEQNDMSACVQYYLMNLSDRYRAVLLLHDAHGLTITEIADLLGISAANAKIRLHRARLKLKTCLENACAFSYDERGVLVCEPKS